MRRLLRMLCAISAISAVGGEATSRADQLAFTDWQATTPFDGPRTSHAPVPVNNRIYILGGLYASGNSFTLYNDVQTALLGNDGSIAKGSWTKTRPFAEPRSGMGVALYRGSSMWYAGLMPDGMLGSWTASPNRLVIPRSNLALEVFVTASGANYLVAIAGVGSIGKDTVHFDTIETAQINADGSIGQWKLCPYHLKGGRSAPGTAVANGNLYVTGGWGDLLSFGLQY